MASLTDTDREGNRDINVNIRRITQGIETTGGDL